MAGGTKKNSDVVESAGGARKEEKEAPAPLLTKPEQDEQHNQSRYERKDSKLVD